MTIVFEERLSDSPYIEKIMHGYAVASGSPVRPAEPGWHLVFVRVGGASHVAFTGPLTGSGVVSYGAGAEILWVKFYLGVFMPHLPLKDFLDRETFLPSAGSSTFWLKSSVWQFPGYENVETFISRLARAEVLQHDLLIKDALNDRPLDLSPRTVRHRFLQSTGQTQAHIRQFQRACLAAERLSCGEPILDVMFDLDYYDQPHLTRSLRRFLGQTPAGIIRASA